MVSLTPKPAKKTFGWSSKKSQSSASLSGSSQSGDDPLPYFTTHWRLFSLLLYLVFCASWVFYFYVRIRYTVPRSYVWYSWTIFAFELIGSSNMFIHCLYMLKKRKYHQVPDDKGQMPLAHDYHVRVLLPCYRESLELIQTTVLATLHAHLPLGCKRTVYLCDDGKDPLKEAWVEEFGRPDLVYIADRVRTPGEINGKSANLNHTLSRIYPPGTVISPEEVLAVFDADQVARPNFFTRTLPWLQSGKESIVLTPQFFHNYDVNADIFNHRSATYWNLILPGQDAWGMISCTGSNFLLRAAHAAEVGWFPTFTMGEDTALALELQCRGRTGVYLPEQLAVGEVPTTLRAVCMQKSRWCKGGYQLYLDWLHCPLLRTELNMWERVLWVYGFWGYMSAVLVTPVFLLVPVVGVLTSIIPVVNSTLFAAAFTAYIGSLYAVIYLGSGSWENAGATWFTNNANSMLWYHYAKSIWNVAWGAIRRKPSTFKATPKTEISSPTPTQPLGVLNSAPVSPPPKKRSKFSSGAAKGAFGDLWISVATFIILAGTIGLGIWRLIADGIVRSTWNFGLLVSLAWCIFNIWPAYLMLHYAAAQEAGLKIACRVAKAVMILSGAGVIALLWWLRPNEYQYDRVLGNSFEFFEARRSGVLPADNRIPWRGDSGLSDFLANGTSGINLVGGYYDQGNSFVKNSYPIAATTTLLSWGLVAFPNGFENAGQSNYARSAIKWGADYLMKAHFDKNSFVAQIGNFQLDNRNWTRPEQGTMYSRTVWVVNATNPGTDICASAAAALAATALAFRSVNNTYALQAANKAVSLYRLALDTEGYYSQNSPFTAAAGQNPAGPYASNSFRDDLAWAAVWLHRVTREAQYLQDAAVYYSRYQNMEEAADSSKWNFNWQNLGPGIAMLMAEATNWKTPNFQVDGRRPNYKADIELYLDNWMDRRKGGDTTVQYTPALLAWTNTTSPLQLNANAGFLAEMYANVKQGKDSVHSCWAESQARYMLGLRGKMSYMIGTGTNAPEQVQDRAASCPVNFRTPCNRQTALLPDAPNPHDLTGALVNGPNEDDEYLDRRIAENSGISLLNNAGFTGLLAALAQQPEDHWSQCNSHPKYAWEPSSTYLF